MTLIRVELADGRTVTFDEHGYFQHCTTLPEHEACMGDEGGTYGLPVQAGVPPWSAGLGEHGSGSRPTDHLRETCLVPGEMHAILHAFANGHVTVDEGERLVAAYALRKRAYNVWAEASR